MTGYQMYIDGVRMPVAPGKVSVRAGSQNQRLTLISGEEINILKSPGLREVSFTLLLPQTSYLFATQDARPASYYLDKLEQLKESKKPFQWILNREWPDGERLFYTNLTVGLEDYEVIDDAGEGFDVAVAVNLRQYRHYGAKTVTVQRASSTFVIQSQRETGSAPSGGSHTVVAGDCLWNIAQRYMGDGNKYPALYAENQALIDQGNRGTGNPRYTIYPGQVLVIPQV